MKKYIFLFLILILSFTFVSCYGSWNIFYDGNYVESRTESILKLDSSDADFSKSDLANLGGSYNVLVLTDLHFGSKKGEPPFNSLFNWLDSVKGSKDAPVFALSLGDSSDVGNKSELDEYLKFCRQLTEEHGIKIIFNTCGNHDMYQGHWDNWKVSCYPHTSFYKFQTKGLSWYALDTASGTIGSNQYEILKKEFAQDSNPKIIFTHYPLTEFRMFGIGLCETTERNLLLDLFVKNNVECYIAGHNHYIRNSYFGFNEYCCPSFRYNKKWAVLHVDGEKGTAYIEYITR